MKEMAEFGKEREYEYKFSIIMAVYNVESFIEEAIDSLIQQDFGFEYHVQLILVDDGSTDRSGEICEEYQCKFPNNVMVIHQENEGLASIFTIAFPLVKGKYISIMEPHKKLSINSLRNIYLAFEEHFEDIDLVDLSKFNKTKEKSQDKVKIHDLSENFFYNIKNIGDFYWKSSEISYLNIRNFCLFNNGLAELQLILLRKIKIGSFVSCGLFSDGDIIPRNKPSNKDCWLWLENFITIHLEEILCVNENLPRHLQLFLLNNISMFIKEKDFLPFSNSIENNLRKTLCRALSHIEDDLIIQKVKIDRELKVYIMNLKYNKIASNLHVTNDIYLYHHQKYILAISELVTKIEIANFSNSILFLEGTILYVNGFDAKEETIFCDINGNKQECELTRNIEEKQFLGMTIYQKRAFKISIPISKAVSDYTIKVYQFSKNIMIEKKNIRTGKFFPISKNISTSYYYINNRILTFKKNILKFSKCSFRELFIYEKKFLSSIYKNSKKLALKVALIRLSTRMLNLLKQKEIWLISDRILRADDNGKAFFEYINLHGNKKIKSYFLISKNCNDYKAVKRVGSVIDYHSLQKKLFYLLSDCIVSSAIGVDVYNPFGDSLSYYQDLYQKKFIFLQHGIIKDDMSNWLNKYKKNFSLFVTSTEGEYNSILDYNYFYSEREVLLSGLPRHDLLYNNPQKKIAIMPTWRTYLAINKSPLTGDWELVPEFEKSEYFKFYDSIINSATLINVSKKMGFHLIFVPHPVIAPHVERFHSNDSIVFVASEKSYREIFAESDLILTDYSSAIFDFSYLRKPVVYTHFDKDSFFDQHYSPGYFDYERDGFGEVEYDLESTVNRIIEYMENGCQLKDKYRERIDNFFAFNDKNNCERVYNAIMDLDKEEEKN